MIELFTDARADPSGPREVELMRLFNGPARAIVDGNGDLLLAGEAHWLSGRIQRQR
jgi:hypothetical protein